MSFPLGEGFPAPVTLRVSQALEEVSGLVRALGASLSPGGPQPREPMPVGSPGVTSLEPVLCAWPCAQSFVVILTSVFIAAQGGTFLERKAGPGLQSHVQVLRARNTEPSQDLNSGLHNFKVHGTKDSVSWMAPFTAAQTCVIRAWDRSKPLLFCPAMNTAMWEHPITAQQVDQLKAFGYVEIPCVAKKLVCGDEAW
ncbi:phosphopantothenoylcysteine decarboxylase isoform X3 [Rhinopithecus roxellana]|uniref:phosphopantothenoylcysteine decarboxylase isoform X3 n=1 Tax=Rhinopithecus roxellana TaxID=61622 RepID=UPI001237854C|nr:phosphopantothenoylcysteine decarboxylase isoform X3 [Rhinopithecus roxellana]